jgi:hypothetical protein
VDGVTDAAGVAMLGRVPTGSYRITVAPPENASLAVTSADVTVPATGLSKVVDVGGLVTLSGTLTGDDAPAGWKLSAIDLGPLAPPNVPSVAVGPNGAYTLQVSPSRPYELVIDTTADKRTRTFVLATGATAPGSATIARVPGARLWRGTIRGAGRVVPGTLVAAFCVAESSTACLDASLPLAQGVSGPDGVVTLAVPNLLDR